MANAVYCPIKEIVKLFRSPFSIIQNFNLKNDLKNCNHYWVVIYGSYLGEGFILGRSDIDIAIITQIKNKEKNIDIWKTLSSTFRRRIIYFRIFLFFSQIMERYGNPL